MADDFTHAQGDRVPGYRKLTDTELEAIKQAKIEEERGLRLIDLVEQMPDIDKRWLAIARTDFQTSMMALVRSIAKPQRLNRLPEDTYYE
jgi:hypothetical protein